MAVGDAHVFLGFLTPVLTQLFFPKPPTTFLTCFWRGERRKYAAEKVRLNRGSNSQPPGHESDTLTTEPPGRGDPRERGLLKVEREKKKKLVTTIFSFSHYVFNNLENEFQILSHLDVAGYKYMLISREANRHAVRSLNGRVQERYL